MGWRTKKLSIGRNQLRENLRPTLQKINAHISQAEVNPSRLSFSATGYKSVHLPVYHNDHLQFHPKVIVYPAIHKLPATTTTERPVYAAPPTIDAAYVLENSPFTCNGLIDGHYADISFDCMFFHQCQVFYKDGQQYIQQAVFPCGEGTLFNQTTKTCDYAENVSCDHLIVESIVRYQQTVPIPTPGPSKAKPIPATSFKCSPHEHKNGYYFADEEANCEVYHRCVYHDEKEVTYATQYSFMCPENLICFAVRFTGLVLDNAPTILDRPNVRHIWRLLSVSNP
ncbi:hypothetical protein GQR58_013755 [Nymphon striatum]|nr:hypothetical protein GQR58_013755 [Nymphon striatum]